MTKEQILAEIAAKIDGQGSAIDAGSALPGILRGILDLIPAEQVNSDWNATEGVAAILNKPTIPEVPSFPQIITGRKLTNEEMQALVRTGIAISPDGKLCALCTDSQLIESLAGPNTLEPKLFLYQYGSDSGEKSYEGYLLNRNESDEYFCFLVQS